MAISKNIIDIIQIQNSCKNVIQELYNYESRPNETIKNSYKSAKIDDAIRLDIIEYDSFDDELSLSPDTEDYYKTRLGQNSETTIGIIDDKLSKLSVELNYYNKRVGGLESTDKEIRFILKILNQIPSLLKYNLYAISSNSIFAFKNESNFDIKMEKLEISHKEIKQLIDASNSVDNFLKEQYSFFKSMNNHKINSLILKIKRNSMEFEDSFRILYEDIKNFINQSIKDGKFIKKLQLLKELKEQNILFQSTNIEEISLNKNSIAINIKERKIHPDNKIFDYIDSIRDMLDKRKIEFENKKNEKDLSYDIDEVLKLEKTIYNYPKLHKKFLSQEDDLITFLVNSGIKSPKLLGVFVRLLKNYSASYNVEDDNFIKIDSREYLKITKREVQ
ncbi:MAG: hypothetical protein U9N02_04585 [Campylobacterota bacterium]|nr:hypothetical protein [Campylobacterota bacterium]